MANELVPAVSAYPAYPALPFQESRGWSPMKQLLFVVFKRRGLILGFFLAFTIAAGVAMLIKPPVRTASAKILLKSDRTSMQISGLASLSGKVPYSPQIMQSEMELLKSRDVLAPVATALLAAKNGNGKTGTGTASAAPAGPTQADIDAAIVSLAANVVPVVLPETNVIELTVFAPTSQGAEKTLGLILDNYQEHHATAYSGSSKLVAFYSQEKERAGVELHAAEDRLKEWQAEANVVAIEGEIDSHLKMLSDRERTLRATEADLDAATAKLATLRRELSRQPERRVMLREMVTNPLIKQLKGDLTAAESTLQDSLQTSQLLTKLRADVVTAEVAVEDSLQRYTEKDRRVQEKRANLTLLKKELADAERAVEASGRDRIAVLKRGLAAAERETEILGRQTTVLNPVVEMLEKDAAGTQALLTSLQSQRDALRHQVTAAAAALDAMRGKKLEVARLARPVDIHRDAFLMYDKRLQEARVSAELDKQQLSNVAVIENPHASNGTDIMKRLAIVVAAAFVGLALGVVTTFGIESFNNSVHTPEELEFHLGRPVLAAIPEFRNGALVVPAAAHTPSLPRS